MTGSLSRQTKIDFEELSRVLASAKGKKSLYKEICEAPFEQKSEAGILFLGFIVLYVVDGASRTVKIADYSNTEQYSQSVDGYDFKTKDYQLSLDKDGENDIVKAILSGKPQDTTDWKSLSRRGADHEQARLNQASGGIAYSAIYPLDIPDGGAMMFSYFQYQENIGSQQRSFMKKYSQMVSAALKTA